MSYFSLHNHTDEGSNTRLIDTINRVNSLLNRAVELDLKGIAITDHESIGAHYSVEKYIKEKRKNSSLEEQEKWKNFKYILGNEIYLCRNDLTKDNFSKEKDKFWHFILLSLDETGHEQLRQLSTRAYQRSFVRNDMVRPYNTYEDLKNVIGENSGHIIGSTACLGSKLDNLILTGSNDDELKSFINFISDIFGKQNLFLELQPSYQEEQIIVNKKLIELSHATGVKAIITTDSHMLRKEDLPLQRAFLNSKDGDREVDDFYSSAYLMNAAEIHEYLDEVIGYNEVEECLKNTLLIGDKVTEYSLSRPFKLPFMPDNKDTLKSLPLELKNNKYFNLFFNSEEESDRIFIKRIVDFMEKGDEWFNRDFWFRPEAIDRLSTELNYLWISSENQKIKWTKYLLQMADYINLIWEEGDSIIAPGRGSAVSETLNYMLGIIQINPLAEKAPMKPWRFINPERASILDIDTDIEATKRDKVIQAFQRKYGEFNVVRVLTKKTEGSKSAILTAARGLGIDNDQASFIASLITADRGQQRSLKDTYYGNEEKDFEPNKTFINEMNNNPKLWEIAQRIEGLVTGLSSHAGGVVIVDEDITKTNSVVRLKSGDYVTAYDLHQSEEMSK